jgi:xylulokinase
MLLIGIDVGTTRLKIVMIRPNGEVVAQASREYAVYRPNPTWVELDLDEIWKSMLVETRRLVKCARRERVVGLAISSQGETVVPVNRDGQCLARAISWTDRRTEQQVEWWRKQYGAWRIYQITGQRIHQMFTVNKLMWLKKHKPDLYRKAYRFLCVEDFFNFRLTSNPITDYSIAARTMMLNLRRREWSSEIIETAGLDQSKLPDLAPSGKPIGEIREDVAKKAGLSRGVQVSTGGHDHSVAAFGVGITRTGWALNDLGTTDSILAVTKGPMLKRRLFEGGYASCPYVKEDRFIVLSGIPTTGAIFRWFRDHFGEAEKAVADRRKMNVYDVMMEEASASQPGALGLLFLPHFAGATMPYSDPKSRGAILGLRLFHTRNDFLRSVAEGIVFEQRNSIDYLEAEGIGISELRAAGGGAANEFWLQLRADILGKRIVVPEVTEATAFGAALLAGIGTKVYRSFNEAQREACRVKRTYNPRQEAQRKYNVFYQLHRRIYPSLERIFRDTQ